MNYRQSTILAQEDATTAKTKDISLEGVDPISRLQIKFNSTNNGNTSTEHFAKQVSLVEIKDGSDVLLSLSAQQIEALMFFEYMKGRYYELEYRNDCENHMVLDILFGRHLYDPELCFDPAKFKNPKLYITHNKASGGCAPDAASLEVYADIFDEKRPSPTGFLQKKQYHTWTTPSSADWERIELPLDMAIRRILLQTYKVDAWWDNLVDTVKLNENNGKRYPWDIAGYDLMKLAATKYGPYLETIVGTKPSGGDDTFYCTPVEVPSIGPHGIGFASTPYIEAERVGGYFKLSGAVVTWRALVMGYIPHGCMPLDCGDLSKIDDFYDVTGKGKVQLEVKAAGSVAFNVVLEQLRKY